MKNRTKNPFIAILLIITICLNFNQSFAQCNIDDWFALKDMYNDANGNNWTNKTNWTIVSANSFPPANCNLGNLYGVSLTNGRVSSINLSNNNLSGSIAPEIDNLTALNQLVLNNNNLSGSLQANIGNLNLNQLQVQNNNLTGCYDGNLSNLCSSLSAAYNTNTYISNGNNFNNSWEGFCTSCSGVCNISDCHIAVCHPDDWFALRNLYFDTNGDNWTDNSGWDMVTGGSIPTPCDLSTMNGITTNINGRVESIFFHSNNLGGTIPVEIDKLVELKRLYLVGTGLTGNIPVEIGNLINLTNINLGQNYLTGSIPSELGNLINLNELYLYTNQLSGNIPPIFNNLPNIAKLDLSNNQLVGNIPADLENLPSLNFLSLANNQLTGNIPSNLENLLFLTKLNLAINQLTGNIPKELNNLSSLEYLYLDNNQLNGNLPIELSELSSLRILNVSNNLLTGEIPGEYNSLGELRVLDIRNNQLSGSIPTQFENITFLRELYASNNQLTGSFPSFFSSLLELEILHLNNNCLAGNLPTEIGNFNSLVTLFLDNNQFNGKLPEELGNLSNLTQLTLHHNQFTYCYEPNLNNLCDQIGPTYNNNASISAANFFDDSWQSFCNNGSGECSDCNNCSVWPGDVNYDGIVNNQDLAISHLYFGESGIARSTPGINWQAYNCPDWGTAQPNGNDIKHHDCDGNGFINTNDKNAIVLNYGKTHPLPPGISAGITPIFTNTDYQIYLQPVNQVNTNTNTLIMNVVFERNSGADIELAGGHFTIDYSQFGANVSNAAMNFEANSWLGNLNINLYEKSWHEVNNKVIHVGFTKTNGNNSIGKGIIGAVTFQLNTANLNRQDPCNTLLNLEINKIGSFNANTDLLPTENENLSVNLSPPCCEPFINISNNTTFQNLYKSSGTITTDSLVIIGKNQQVEYRANRVTLTEGFSARAGAQFKVRSSACN